MPFLYDPDDSDFDVGEYASSWSYPDSNIGAESNSSRVTRTSGRAARVFSSSAQTYRPANNGPFPSISAQDSRHDVTPLARGMRGVQLMLDAISETSRHLEQVNPLAAHPPTLGESNADARRTIIDATGPISRQPRQVMPTTVNSPRLTSRSVQRATDPMHRRIRTPMAEGNAPTQRQQYHEARSQRDMERRIIRRERLVHLQAGQISGGDSSAEHQREEADGPTTVDTVDSIEQSTARD